MIAIVDYGVGNLFSLRSSFAAIGEDAVVTGDEGVLRQADRLILPGVGAFRDAMDKLRKTGLHVVIQEEAARGKPLLGICLGMQMLFEKSLEYGEHEGLGLLSGTVRPISGVAPAEYKIPHIGWNALSMPRKSRILSRTPEGAYVYFVHSYYAADCEESVVAVTDYGALLTAAVEKDNVMGCQFHPEKSGNTGLTILKTFCEA